MSFSWNVQLITGMREVTSSLVYFEWDRLQPAPLLNRVGCELNSYACRIGRHRIGG